MQRRVAHRRLHRRVGVVGQQQLAALFQLRMALAAAAQHAQRRHACRVQLVNARLVLEQRTHRGQVAGLARKVQRRELALKLGGPVDGHVALKGRHEQRHHMRLIVRHGHMQRRQPRGGEGLGVGLQLQQVLDHCNVARRHGHVEGRPAVQRIRHVHGGLEPDEQIHHVRQAAEHRAVHRSLPVVRRHIRIRASLQQPVLVSDKNVPKQTSSLTVLPHSNAFLPPDTAPSLQSRPSRPRAPP